MTWHASYFEQMLELSFHQHPWSFFSLLWELSRGRKMHKNSSVFYKGILTFLAESWDMYLLLPRCNVYEELLTCKLDLIFFAKRRSKSSFTFLQKSAKIRMHNQPIFKKYFQFQSSSLSVFFIFKWKNKIIHQSDADFYDFAPVKIRKKDCRPIYSFKTTNSADLLLWDWVCLEAGRCCLEAATCSSWHNEVVVLCKVNLLHSSTRPISNMK